MIIKRQAYLDALKIRQNNTMIKVITGMRRAGKSFLLNTIFYDHLLNSGIPSDHIIRFAFDSVSDLEMIGVSIADIMDNKGKVCPETFVDFIRGQIQGDDMYYLLLDEVQNLEGFEYVLNTFLRRDNLDIYVTGSNAKFLVKDVITEFAGRGDEVRVYPLSFSEYMGAYKGTKEDGLRDYLAYGGLPMMLNFNSEEQKISYLRNVFNEAYLRDIRYRHNLKNVSDLEDLIDVLSSSVGSLTNPLKLSNTFKTAKGSDISKNTVVRYLGYLEDSFLVESASQYDVKGRKYIGSQKKYYFMDLGLRNVRIGFRQTEVSHLTENLIFNELRTRGFLVDVGVVPVRRPAEGGSETVRYEIDFIANKGSRRYYIQSAYSMPSVEKTEQEERPFSSVRDSFKKVIITADAVATHYNENGTLILYLYDFLLEPNSLDFRCPGR